MAKEKEKSLLTPILLFMGLLMGLTVVFLMALGSGFFEAIFQIFVFIYEVIDELWEK